MALVRPRLIQIIRTATRRPWVGLGTAALICILGWAGIGAIPDRFEATALLYVDFDTLLRDGTVRRGQGGEPSTQAEILRSMLLYRPSLETRIDGVGRDLALADIIVTGRTKNLFTIAYRDTNPVMARDVVRTLLTIFVQNSRRTGTDYEDRRNARRFLEGQIQSQERTLRGLERGQADFRRRHAELFEDGLNPEEATLDDARSTVTAFDDALRDAMARRNAVRRKGEEAPSTLVPPTGAAPPSAPNPAQEKARSMGDDARWDLLARQREEARARLGRLETLHREQPDLVMEYRNLQRDHAMARERYKNLLERLKAAYIWLEPWFVPERAMIQIVDTPEIPHAPIAPNRRVLNGCVLLTGLAAGFAVSWLCGGFAQARCRDRSPGQAGG